MNNRIESKEFRQARVYLSVLRQAVLILSQGCRWAVLGSFEGVLTFEAVYEL